MILMSFKLMLNSKKTKTSPEKPSLGRGISRSYNDSNKQVYPHWSLYHYPKAHLDFFENANRIKKNRIKQASILHPHSFSTTRAHNSMITTPMARERHSPQR